MALESILDFLAVKKVSQTEPFWDSTVVLVSKHCRCGAFAWLGDPPMCSSCAEIKEWSGINRQFCNGLHRGVWR